MARFIIAGHPAPEVGGASSGMLIRPYRAGEELDLLAVFQSSVRGLATRHYTAEQIDAWAPQELTQEMRATWINRIRSNHPWVAEMNGTLAGFADLQPSGYIDQFFVAAPWSGQGVGTALMAQLHKVASAHGMTRLYAHVSLTAQAFFTAHGFATEEERVVTIRGIALRNALMTKQIHVGTE